MNGSRTARSRTIRHDALPLPMIIDARSSTARTRPARRISPTSRRLARCSVARTAPIGLAIIGAAEAVHEVVDDVASLEHGTERLDALEIARHALDQVRALRDSTRGRTHRRAGGAQGRDKGASDEARRAQDA